MTISRPRLPRPSSSLVRLSLALAILACLSLAASASDLAGNWQGQSDAGFPIVLVFQEQGGQLSGSMQNPEGKQLPMKDLKFADNRLSCAVESEYQGQPITLELTGTLKAGTLTLTMATADGSWSTTAELKRDTATAAAAPSAPAAAPTSSASAGATAGTQP